MTQEAFGGSPDNGQADPRPATSAPPRRPSSEVVPRPQRRSFTAAYKRRVLEQADQCCQRGELGALLRREGLYSSHLVEWRRQRRRGRLGQVQRGQPPASAQGKEIARLQREMVRLQQRLVQAEAIIAVQKKLASLLGALLRGDADGREALMQAARELGQVLGLARACALLQVPRSSLYAGQGGSGSRPAPPASRELAAPAPRPAVGRGLSLAERQQVRDLLDSPRFQDQAPRQVWATLLDEKLYVCSVRTMYRILAVYGEVRERRAQRRHPVYAKPELLATRPNLLWSWDVTQLRGPAAGIWYYLYVMLDVFSRYVVGWMIAERQTQELAADFIRTSCESQGIGPAHLTVHADRGAIQQAQSVSALFVTLGVTESHGRPQVSNDNPYSEAQFRTTKYHPSYPERFGSPLDARLWARAFFDWYNHEHYHTGLGLLTPAMVHFGQAPQVQAQRQQVLDGAYAAHPERFVRRPPRVLPLPTEVWINRPDMEPLAANTSVILCGELSKRP
ncbi:MAG: IS3 family transposase [Candidatus Latescibacterota bacterium]